MRTINLMTHLVHTLTRIVDLGTSYSVKEIEEHIANRDLIEWLEQQFPSDSLIDFSPLGTKERDFIYEKLQILQKGYSTDNHNKWGINNNGLYLLISWCVEIIRLNVVSI